jgi:DNA polymerase-3 subunit alpha
MLELGVQWRVTPADDLLYQLTLMLGEEKIALQFK